MPDMLTRKINRLQSIMKLAEEGDIVCANISGNDHSVLLIALVIREWSAGMISSEEARIKISDIR